MPKQTTMQFVDAINCHDVEQIVELMHTQHTFIDAYGNTENKKDMLTGWPGYFAWFPDYHIEVTEYFVQGDTVALFGFASGTYKGIEVPDGSNHWRLPAAWRAIALDRKILCWQVYCDSKIPFTIMDTWGKAPVEGDLSHDGN